MPLLQRALLASAWAYGFRAQGETARAGLAIGLGTPERSADRRRGALAAVTAAHSAALGPGSGQQPCWPARCVPRGGRPARERPADRAPGGCPGRPGTTAAARQRLGPAGEGGARTPGKLGAGAAALRWDRGSRGRHRGASAIAARGRPGAARGVAMASTLLTDGAG